MKRILATFALIAFNSGCGGNNCERDAENYRPRACAIKVESHSFKWRWFSMSGTNANDGTRNTYSDLGAWYSLFTEHIAVGDTVIKRRNELVFYVHKKDTVLAFPFTCEGQVFK